MGISKRTLLSIILFVSIFLPTQTIIQTESVGICAPENPGPLSELGFQSKDSRGLPFAYWQTIDSEFCTNDTEINVFMAAANALVIAVFAYILANAIIGLESKLFNKK